MKRVPAPEAYPYGNGKETEMTGNGRVNTTLAKQLANWVILYSPLQMASDLIEHYERHPAFQFFRDFNPDCDWSKALQGEIGEYIVIVRKAGNEYFLGASTNEETREIELPLDFLEIGKNYQATIYADAPDADWKTNPTAYTITNKMVTNQTTLKIKMAPGGGQAIHFSIRCIIPKTKCTLSQNQMYTFRHALISD